jgi:hypothetical protein
LFAALDIRTGHVIGHCYARHRAVEFRRGLDRIEAAVPSDLDAHLSLDNCVTHKTPLIRRWLAKRPRYHLHFTPASASWLNLVERWFVELTRKQLQRGAHRSTPGLIAATRDYIVLSDTPPRRSYGPRQPTKSWRVLHASVSDRLTQDMRPLSRRLL